MVLREAGELTALSVQNSGVVVTELEALTVYS